MPEQGPSLAELRPQQKQRIVKTPDGKYQKEKTPKIKKREFKRNGKPMKGLYYHAAEFERKKQQERGMVGRMAAAFFEPFALQVRRYMLSQAVKDYQRGHKGESPILTDAFVKQSLSHLGRKFFVGDTGDVIPVHKAAEAAGRAHKTLLKTVGNAHDMSNMWEQEARSLLQKVVNAEGNLRPEEILRIAHETKVAPDEIAKLGKDVQIVFQDAQRAGVKFETPEQIKQAITDQLLYAGLTPAQQEQARKVARNANLLLLGGVVRTFGIPLAGVVAPLGIIGGIIAGGGGLAAATTSRVFSLKTQGGVYDTNKAREVSGITNNPHFAKGVEKILSRSKAVKRLGKLLSVDWNKDSRGWQLARAAAAGAIVGLVLKFGPELPGLIEHLPGDIGNFAHGISEHIPSLGHGHTTTGTEHASSPTPTLSGSTTEVQVPGFANTEIKIPENWHFGVALNHQDPHALYDNQGNEVATHFSLDHGQMSFDFTKPYADGNGIHQTIASGTGETDSFSQFVAEHSSTQLQLNHPSADLPAGGQEAYGMTDYINGKSFVIQSYDHLGDQANALVAQVHVGNHVENVVFMPTGTTPDGHPLWEFTPGGKNVVNVWQDGHEVQVTSGEAADMLHITPTELTNWATSGHPAGVSSDFDYSVGQNILGHNLLFGNVHEDAQGHFVFDQLGQIRGHSGDLSDGNYNHETVFDFTSKIHTLDEEPFQSPLAPEISQVDSWEDGGILWLAQHGFGNGIVQPADAVTDVGMWGSDILAATPYVGLPLFFGTHIGTGVLGYMNARTRAHGNKLPRIVHARRGIEEAALVGLLPGAAVTAALGNVIGRVHNTIERRRERKENRPPAKPTGATGPTASNPSPTPPANPATVAAEAAATVPATIAVEETAQIPPAPATPPTETNEATLATAVPATDEEITPPPAIPEERTATAEPIAEIPVTLPTSSPSEEVATEAVPATAQAEIATPALSPTTQEVAEANLQGTYPDQLKLLENTFPAGNTLQANQGGDYEQFEIIGYVKDGENWKVIANGKKGDQVFQGLSYNMDQLEKLVAAGQTQNVQNTVLPIAPDLVSHIGETIQHNNERFHIYGVGIRNGSFVYLGKVINPSNGAEDLTWQTVDTNVIA